MWIEVESSHFRIINLKNANMVYIQYTGAHGYDVMVGMVSGFDTFIKKFGTEKEATDFVKALYLKLV